MATTYLTKDEIVKRIAKEAGVKIVEMNQVYSKTMSVLADILSELGEDQKITISGLGSFEGRVRRGEMKAVDKAYETRGIKFKISDTLKKRMNGKI